MVKKHSKLSEDFSKSLRGFEEIFEEYMENEETKEKARQDKEISRTTESYELQNFLEEENSRLSKLDIFLTKKIPAKINFSQAERLIVEQLMRKNELKEVILIELCRPESQINSNLSHLFNAHFS